jgi:hypothetical protein
VKSPVGISLTERIDLPEFVSALVVRLCTLASGWRRTESCALQTVLRVLRRGREDVVQCLVFKVIVGAAVEILLGVVVVVVVHVFEVGK